MGEGEGRFEIFPNEVRNIRLKNRTADLVRAEKGENSQLNLSVRRGKERVSKRVQREANSRLKRASRILSGEGLVPGDRSKSEVNS